MDPFLALLSQLDGGPYALALAVIGFVYMMAGRYMDMRSVTNQLTKLQAEIRGLKAELKRCHEGVANQRAAILSMAEKLDEAGAGELSQIIISGLLEDMATSED